MDKIKVGSEIEAYCGKCKSDTVHVISSITKEKIEKLMCKTCNAHHKYRKPKGSIKKVVLADKKATEQKEQLIKKRSTRRNKWTRMLDKTEVDTAVKYKMDENYELAMAINHETFGLGIVKEIINSRKIEVLFHDGEKVLVQNLIR